MIKSTVLEKNDSNMDLFLIIPHSYFLAFKFINDKGIPEKTCLRGNPGVETQKFIHNLIITNKLLTSTTAKAPKTSCNIALVSLISNINC
jgi:hypothetical protein